jgi:hypothetical protein
MAAASSTWTRRFGDRPVPIEKRRTARCSTRTGVVPREAGTSTGRGSSIGCGHCRRAVRSASAFRGRLSGSPSPTQRSTQHASWMPPTPLGRLGPYKADRSTSFYWFTAEAPQEDRATGWARGHTVVTNRAESLNDLGRNRVYQRNLEPDLPRGDDSGPCAGNGVKVQVLSSALLMVRRFAAAGRWLAA